jgi:phage/plasmid-associated DNA primase
LEERQGILNKMIAGLQRLLQNGRFSIEPTLEETEKEYLRLSDPIGYFAKYYIEVVPDDEKPYIHTSNDDLFNAYFAMCRKELDVVPRPRQTFIKHFEAKVEYSDKRRKSDSDRTTGFFGIRIKRQQLQERLIDAIFIQP